MSNKVVIKRALMSVSDKTGLIPLAKELRKRKVEILSTGGTLKALKEAGINAVAVEDFTGFPEMLEGRVKTLHPKIHGGLLYRRDKKAHTEEAKKHGILPIDLVVVNLYPFESVTAREGVKLEEAIENIDIGGPSMLRSAAKNFAAVTVVCDPMDYAMVLEQLEKNGGAVEEPARRLLAEKVFERTSNYDRVIAKYLSGQRANEGAAPETGLPEKFEVLYSKIQDLRYGENPHQRAAYYRPGQGKLQLPYTQLHGKELSYNNILDIEAALDTLREFDHPAACVMKHNNPSGIAEGDPIVKTLEEAIECDAMSAFGGIIGVNQPCDKKIAEAALDALKFFEVFIAPSFDQGALTLLQERKNLRIIVADTHHVESGYDLRFLKSGMLLQDRNNPIRLRLAEFKKHLKVVTQTAPSPSEIEDLIFAWKCAKIVKSNAIVLTQGRKTVGIGAGQMSRVDSVYIACQKAGYRAEHAMLASDA
ncbi:MAG: bifunctional phosphoribosylaminoimidazolecarboxamide formyltransferase/IMP cyclohydrolase, partial [Candidatus Omnitrophica bacterium]|nr:bifunctional phosphoribosylaminoimidazolecarboxamide formyltransferase/IMP cyclohydrolase [Candidatus Omnitrophota bacterium]